MTLHTLAIRFFGVVLLAQSSLAGTITLDTIGRQKILIVGDSHLGGTYGQRLYTNLSYGSKGGSFANEVALYSACGSTSRDWSGFDPAAQRSAPCGLRVATPKAPAENPISEIPPQKVPYRLNGRQRIKLIYPKVPVLNELLKGNDFAPSFTNQKPDVVIVSLGTNMIGSVPSNIDDSERAFQKYYSSRVWAQRNNYPGLFSEIDKIFAAQSMNAPYARCVWVGPPACDRMADGSPCLPRLNILNRTMAKVLLGRCTYIDSTKLTEYPPEGDPESPLTDGYHFSATCRSTQLGCKEKVAEMRAIATGWADAVFKYLLENNIVRSVP